VNDEQRPGDAEPTEPIQPIGPRPDWTPPGSSAPPPAPAPSYPPPIWQPREPEPEHLDSHDEPAAAPELDAYPAPSAPPAYAAPAYSPQLTRPLPAPTPAHAADGRRPSGWTWPVVAVLALVLGLAGGVAGSVVYNNTGDRADGGGGFGSGNGLSTSTTVTAPPIKLDEGSIAAVAQELLPSTVLISAEYGGESGGATGSGFVLDTEGHVVTNNHVVEAAAQDEGPIEIVDQDGNRYDATVVGRSPVYDIAVLYSDQAKKMKPAALGDAAGLHVGDSVVAIGSPLGLSSTVTAGIVSALERPVTTGDSTTDSSYINAVQTDAAINPGNSGGPLVNLAGQVVGVNSAIATTGGGGLAGTESGNIGVGFAIPIEQVKVTADQILRTGEARYPVIGAKVLTGQRDGAGAEIDDVVSGTPAEEAGLEKGDVVVALEGKKVTDGIALIVSIRSHQPGETLTFTVQRGGEEQDFEVTLDSEVG
jgi:putative serine protease PepD